MILIISQSYKEISSRKNSHKHTSYNNSNAKKTIYKFKQVENQPRNWK